MATQRADGDARPAVLYERVGNVALITLNRPERRNAMGQAVRLGIVETFGRASAEHEVRAIVLTGAGDQAFCAGADLKERAADATQRGGVSQDVNDIRQPPSALMAVFETYKPVIAAVNGYAVAGGCELAIACDIRLAAEHARFGLFEAKRGMGANFATVMLQYVTSRGAALEMLFTGDQIDAPEAYRIGLVNKVIPSAALLDEALRLAQSIARNAPISLRRMKELANKSIGVPPLFALRMGPGPSPYTSEDATEGARAFVEKRDPVWRGR